MALCHYGYKADWFVVVVFGAADVGIGLVRWSVIYLLGLIMCFCSLRGGSEMKFGHKLINGRDAADKMLSVLKEELDSIRARGWQPSLASITVGDVDEVKLYVRNQKRFATRIGI